MTQGAACYSCEKQTNTFVTSSNLLVERSTILNPYPATCKSKLAFDTLQAHKSKVRLAKLQTLRSLSWTGIKLNMLERCISLKTCIANAVFILSLFSAHLNVVVTCSQLPMVPSSTQGRIFEKPLGDEMVLGSGELAPKLYHMLKNRVPRLLLSTDERDRKLQFQDLEDILDEIVLTLPSFEFSAGRLLFNDVDVTVQAVVCNNFAISNIIIGHERKNDQEVSLNFEIDGLGFYCSFQYEYVSCSRTDTLALCYVLELMCLLLLAKPKTTGLADRWKRFCFSHYIR